MALNRLEIIESNLRVAVGGSIIEPEGISYSDYIKLACLRFYQALPIKRTIQVSVTFGTVTVSISDAMTQFFGSSLGSYYFLGVSRSDYVLTGEQFQSGNIDLWLSGAGGVNINQRGVGQIGPIFDPIQTQYEAAIRDTYVTPEHIEMDEINNSIRIVTSTEGSITLELAFGYCGDENAVNSNNDPVPTNSYDGVPYNHLILVADLAAEKYLEDLISGRSAVRLSNSNFELDVTALTSKYEFIRDKNELTLGQIATPILLLG